jgi:hypothetical protein
MKEAINNCRIDMKASFMEWLQKLTPPGMNAHNQIEPGKHYRPQVPPTVWTIGCIKTTRLGVCMCEE